MLKKLFTLLTLSWAAGAMAQTPDSLKLEQLQEVVVTGYQTISRERATGAFGKVEGTHLAQPTANIGERLIGSVAGLAATTDAEGKFSVQVVQTDKIYNANFAKEGYKDVNLEGVDFANGNVVLQEPVVMEPDALTGVESMNAGKAVAGVKYYNVAGQASDKAFKGVNIVVTTYTDDTTRTVKVVK